MWRVVSYYTEDTPYEKEIMPLRSSLYKYSIPNTLRAIPKQRSWDEGVSYKDTFIRRMLDETDDDIVFVHADTEFLKYPDMFDHMLFGIIHGPCIEYYANNIQSRDHLTSVIPQMVGVLPCDLVQTDMCPRDNPILYHRQVSVKYRRLFPD